MDQKRKRPVRTFVRRGGRMTATREEAYQRLYPQWGIPFREEPLDWQKVFPLCREVVLEIGFGMGEASREIAQSRPETGFLCVEVHHPGIAKMLAEIEGQDIKNIRVIEHDAVEVLRSMIPSESLDGVHIFFPDPWPKKKHHKRRLIQKNFIRELCNKIKPGGYIYTATDWEDYAEQMKEVLESFPGVLENPSQGYARDISWRPGTRFEKKGREKNFPIREVFVIKTGGSHD